MWPLAVGIAVTAFAALVWLRSEPDADLEAERTPVLSPAVVARYPHDPSAFTQGLLIEDDELWESTGLYGESTLRRVDLESGRVLDSLSLGEAYFGEGLAALDGRLYQLTWKEGTTFVYDAETMAPLDTLGLWGEGWGLAEDSSQLIWSDGSDRLRWIDPASWSVTREVSVRDQGQPVRGLNELEVVDGLVYANIWGTGRIAVIDPADGRVARWLDFTSLDLQHRGAGADVMNGIAHDPATNRLLLTGKLWPTVYAVEVPQ
ncbi:glutaminyl-peptide cyclotransferase [Rubrivirga sp.]|uniref:glutaminyl-peptide cyclotransferase n=1 Tax=Rubrivirga sp. TaxID=1885344 RepID=UPI003C756747